MKNLHVFLMGSLIISSSSIFCQTIETLVAKKEYKRNETISVTFEAQIKVDSSEKANFVDFDILEGPYKTASTSIVNGISKSSCKLSYTIRAKRSGSLKILPPKFYCNNVEITGTGIIIRVSEDQLTDADKKEIAFNEFIEKASKPDGTFRYVIKDDMGYVEKYIDSEWEFSRKLKKNEIEKINKIK